MRRYPNIFCLAALLLFSSTSSASLEWYHGKVTRIYLHGDGFVLRMDTSVLDDCLYKYVYYKVSTLGDQKVNRAYSMALTAQSSGRTVGVIIDKAINGPGGQCNSNGSMDITD